MIRYRLAPAVTSLAILAMWSVGSVAAEPHLCEGIPVTVRAGSDAPVAAICDAALAASTFISRCGMPLKRGLTIRLVDEIVHPCGTRTLGQFVPSDRLIEVTSLTRCSQSLGADNAYRRLPLIDVWRSLITHEVAHGILYAQPGADRLPASAQEYVAYAVQIGTMSADTRAAFLGNFPEVDISDLASFTGFAHDVEPLRFGARAYRHFTAPHNGCALLDRVLRGEVAFPSSPPP